MEHGTETPRTVKRLLAVGAIGLAGAVALTGCSLLEGDVDTDAGEVSNSAVNAASDAAPGDCLTIDFAGADDSEFSIDCEDPAAYWTVTAITDETDAEVSGEALVDNQPVFDLCGEAVGSLVPGQPLTDWNMIYDPTTGAVDYLFCTEAKTEANADGKTAAIPAEGECFNSAEFGMWTTPCDAADADSSVTGFVELELGEYAATDLEEAAAACEMSYYDLIDQFGRASGVLCIA